MSTRRFSPSRATILFFGRYLRHPRIFDLSPRRLLIKSSPANAPALGLKRRVVESLPAAVWLPAALFALLRCRSFQTFTRRSAPASVTERTKRAPCAPAPAPSSKCFHHIPLLNTSRAARGPAARRRGTRPRPRRVSSFGSSVVVIRTPVQPSDASR